MEQSVLILATSGSRFSEVLRYLGRAGTSRENLIFILFAVIIAGIWVSLFVWDRLRRSSSAHAFAVRTLFDQLCQAHRLGPHDITLLADAARECGLSSPCLLFVQPEHLGRLADDDLQHAAGYRQLRERLFGAI